MGLRLPWGDFLMVSRKSRAASKKVPRSAGRCQQATEAVAGGGEDSVGFGAM